MKKGTLGNSELADFTGTHDLMNYIEENKKAKFYASRNNSDDFAGCSYPEAQRLLERGWEQGAKDMEFLVDGIKARMAEFGGDTIEFDVMGDYIDMGDYVSGEPECWGHFEEAPAPRHSVKVVVNIAYSCGVPTELIFRRGACISALVDELRKQNDVYLEFVQTVEHICGKHFTFRLTVDTKNDYSRALIAYLSAHASTLRRIIFRVEEIFFDRDCGAYGTPCSITQFDKNYIDNETIYFDKLRGSTHPDFDTMDKAAATVKRILEEFKVKHNQGE